MACQESRGRLHGARRALLLVHEATERRQYGVQDLLGLRFLQLAVEVGGLVGSVNRAWGTIVGLSVWVV